MGGLKKAEDDLARERFRKDVKDEWRRIESVVDIELERMATLEEGVDLDLYDRCAVCDQDISNDLLLMKKNGSNKIGKLLCCGRTLCPPCLEKGDPMRRIKEQLDKIELEGGVLQIQAPPHPTCPSCGGDPSPVGDKKCFKAIEKLAQQGVVWAIGELSFCYATGKYTTKKNPQKAKKWLTKAVKAKDTASMYHLAQLYGKEWRQTNAVQVAAFGGFTPSSEKSIELFLAAADKGCIAAYLSLSRIYLLDKTVERDQEQALWYGSLAAYQTESDQYGKVCAHMSLLHHHSESSFSLNPRAESSPERDTVYNLCTYWSGKAAEVDNDGFHGQALANQIVMCAAYDFWFKYTQNKRFPGYSTLCLAKRLEMKYKAHKSSTFIVHFEDHCALCSTKEGKLKKCQGCKVFHYCGRECQKKHWKDGHKKECNGNHWVLEHFPKLKLDL